MLRTVATTLSLIQLLVVTRRTAAFNHHATPASDAMSRVGAAEGECRSLRILCLHGKGGNGEDFAVSSLAPLRETVVERRLAGLDANVEWHHLTGPFRTNDEDASANAWWTLRPGERSFNAKEVRDAYFLDDCVLHMSLKPNKV